jgi:hypothetical protein
MTSMTLEFCSERVLALAFTLSRGRVTARVLTTRSQHYVLKQRFRAVADAAPPFCRVHYLCHRISLFRSSHAPSVGQQTHDIQAKGRDAVAIRTTRTHLPNKNDNTIITVCPWSRLAAGKMIIHSKSRSPGALRERVEPHARWNVNGIGHGNGPGRSSFIHSFYVVMCPRTDISGFPR